MRASSSIGRVGGLALALGVGLGLSVVCGGPVWAAPDEGSADSATSAEAPGSGAGAVQRSREGRGTPARSQSAQAGSGAAVARSGGVAARPGGGDGGRPAAVSGPVGNDAPAPQSRVAVEVPVVSVTGGGVQRRPAGAVSAPVPSPVSVEGSVAGPAVIATPVAAPVEVGVSGTVQSAPTPPTDVDPGTPAESALSFALLAAARRQWGSPGAGTAPAAAVTSAQAVSPTSNLAPRAYVTNFASNSVSVVDTATNTVVRTISDGIGIGPAGVAVNPAGTLAFVPNIASNTVSVINTATSVVSSTVSVGKSPVGVAFSADGTRAYVSNAGDGTVSVIDVAAAKPVELRKYTVGVGPGVVVVSGTKVYVANNGGDSVSVIDTVSNTVQTIAEIKTPAGLALNPAGTLAFVTSQLEDTVSVIDIAKRQKLYDIPVGQNPSSLAINAAGTRAYVANYFDGTVSVIDIASTTAKVIATIGVGAETAHQVAVTPYSSLELVYVTTPKGATAIFNNPQTTGPNSWTIAKMVTTGTDPAGVAFWGSSTMVPVVSISGPAQPVNEGAAAPGQPGRATFTVALANGAVAASDVTVSYSVAGSGTSPATAGTDFVAPPGSVRIRQGQSSASFDVVFVGDAVNEADETFTVTLTGVSGATLGSSGLSASATIRNDDAGVSPVVTIGPASQRVAEGGATNTSSAKFTVALANGATAGPGGVEVALVYDFAGPESRAWATRADLFSAPDKVTIRPNTSSASFDVFFLGDSVDEPDETFKVSLGTASGAVLSTSGRSALATIANDDPALRILDASVSEGQSGTTKVRFEVSLSATPRLGPVTVEWATSDGPAGALGATVADRDYAAGRGVLTFAKDTTALTQFVEVTINGDNKVEQNETFTVSLTKPSGAPVARGSATGTITNDDRNSPPVAGTPSATVNASSGRVSGNVNATDPDKDTLTYTEITGTTLKGSYTISRNGDYTYTPTDRSRRLAGQNTPSPDSLVDSFSATVSDGRGGTTTVPVSVRVTPPLPRIYLTNSDGSVYVLRTDTDAIEATLRDPKALPGQRSGSLPRQGPALVATSSYNTYSDASYQPLVYVISPQSVNLCNGVACQPTGPVSVINSATNRIVATNYGLSSFFGASGFAVQPFRTQPGGSFTGLNAYVPVGNTIQVISPGGTNLGSITLGDPTFGPRIESVAFNKTGTRAYAATERAGVYVIDTAQRKVLYSIDLPDSAVLTNGEIAVDAADRVYIPAVFSGSPQRFGNVVYVVDTVKRQAEPITVGTSPRGVALNQAGTRAYVANWNSNTVSIIDTATKKVVETIATPQASGSRPNWIAVAETPAGPVVYVVNQGEYGCSGSTCAWTGSGVWKFNDFGTSRQPAVLNLSSYLKGPFNKWQGLAVSAW